jgi:hypothetical protein
MVQFVEGRVVGRALSDEGGSVKGMTGREKDLRNAPDETW